MGNYMPIPYKWITLPETHNFISKWDNQLQLVEMEINIYRAVMDQPYTQIDSPAFFSFVLDVLLTYKSDKRKRQLSRARRDSR